MKVSEDTMEGVADARMVVMAVVVAVLDPAVVTVEEPVETENYIFHASPWITVTCVVHVQGNPQLSAGVWAKERKRASERVGTVPSCAKARQAVDARWEPSGHSPNRRDCCRPSPSRPSSSRLRRLSCHTRSGGVSARR